MLVDLVDVVAAASMKPGEPDEKTAEDDSRRALRRV
jgi:hypothetical protein